VVVILVSVCQLSLLITWGATIVSRHKMSANIPCISFIVIELAHDIIANVVLIVYYLLMLPVSLLVDQHYISQK